MYVIMKVEYYITNILILIVEYIEKSSKIMVMKVRLSSLGPRILSILNGYFYD